jgi:hypothetical protein
VLYGVEWKCGASLRITYSETSILMALAWRERRKEIPSQLQFPESETICVPPGCELQRHATKLKGEIAPVFNQLSTTSRRRMEEWRYSSTTLDLDTGWRWVVTFTPRPLPVPVGQEAGCAPELVWTPWKGETSPCRESNPGYPARITSLYRLRYRSSTPFEK